MVMLLTTRWFGFIVAVPLDLIPPLQMQVVPRLTCTIVLIIVTVMLVFTQKKMFVTLLITAHKVTSRVTHCLL